MARDRAYPGVEVQVEGLKELRSELRRLDKALPKELRPINKDAADAVRDTAKDEAPHISGKLIRSITSRAGQKDASVKAGSAARVPYAGPVIFGHNPRPQGGFTEPNNFLLRALGIEYDYIRKLYDERINKLAKKHL
jgi:hypothetical protein